MFSQWCNAGFQVRLGEIKAPPHLTARLTENTAAPSCTVRNPKKTAASPPMLWCCNTTENTCLLGWQPAIERVPVGLCAHACCTRCRQTLIQVQRTLLLHGLLLVTCCAYMIHCWTLRYAAPTSSPSRPYHAAAPPSTSSSTRPLPCARRARRSLPLTMSSAAVHRRGWCTAGASAAAVHHRG